MKENRYIDDAEQHKHKNKAKSKQHYLI